MSPEKSDRRSQRRSNAFRLAVLIGVLAVSTVIGLIHQRVSGVAPAGVDALCPFGGIEAAFTLLTAGAFLPKIAASALILLVATVLVALVFRRAFCGQICPLGTIQELFGRLGKRLFRRRPVMPKALDRPARFLKYAVLAVFTVWTWAAADLVMRPYDPWATYHHLTSEELFATFPIGLAVLGLTVAGSIVYDRFFCKYLCPMGALLGAISRFGVFRVRRDSSACIDCGACDKACPMNLDVSKATTVDSAECIACSGCVNACPVEGALKVTGPNGSRLKPVWLTAATLGIMVFLVGATTAAGSFSWTTKSIVAETRKSGNFEAGDINGRTSMKEIADASGVPLPELLDRFKVPASEASRPLKDIKDTYDFSPEDVRAYVEERLAGGQ